MCSLRSLLFVLPAFVLNVVGTGVPRLGCANSCATLAARYDRRVHYKSNDTSFAVWDQKASQTVYECRVEPSSAEEVSGILGVLTHDWCNFSVLCGGHSRYSDDSVSIGGVVIDLARLNTTIVSDDQTTAKVGGGSTSRQVFAALDQYGLAYVGGRVGQVGMGGFTLGGGTSVVAPKYGWALDNVFEYEIVLANGTITTVSETQQPDLYWALRGGAGNFGIVTSFTVGVFPLGQVYTGSRSFPDNVTTQFLEEAEKLFVIEDEEDTNVVLEYTYTYNAAADTYSMSSTQRYFEPIMSPSVYDSLNSLPALSPLRGGFGTLAASTSFGGRLGTSRNVFTTLSHYPSVELGTQGINIYKEEVQKTRGITDFSAAWITYSLPAPAIAKMKVRGGNALGIDVDGHLIINLMAVSWSGAQNDAAAMAFADAFITRLQTAAEELEVYHPYKYINYANKNQDPFSGYGQANRQRLTSIQKTVDPEGIFTSKGLWPGFFKLH